VVDWLINFEGSMKRKSVRELQGHRGSLTDRLLHHSTRLNINGESYRHKEIRRARLLGGASVAVPGE